VISTDFPVKVYSSQILEEELSFDLEYNGMMVSCINQQDFDGCVPGFLSMTFKPGEQ